MLHPALPQPNSYQSLTRNETMVQPSSAIRANTMPTLQQTIHGLAPVENVGQSNKYEENSLRTKIYHPRMAPSSISSEEFLVARFSFSPQYSHNMAATRDARTSNLHEETPRFRDQIDILA